MSVQIRASPFGNTRVGVGPSSAYGVTVRLNTLGSPHILLGDGEEVVLPPLQTALLAYLAIGGPRDRGHLADLFWHDSENGLNSLSSTLTRIRTQVPGSLWVQGNSVVGSDLASDVGELRSAIDRSDVDAVSRLYRAPFLGTVRLRRQSVEFEEWMLEERDALASLVESTLLRRGRELFDAGDYRAAALAAEGAWEITNRDGFPSADYFDTYYQILATASRPTARAVRTIAEEFGIDLTPVEPVVFASGAQSGELAESAAAPAADEGALGFAGPARQLFGCEEELEAIASSVASHGLTTIIGLGGAGKTRLAAEFFASSNVDRDYAHKYWVNLRDVTDPKLVAPAISASLGPTTDDVASLVASLPDGEPVLLVLDNFEHLVEVANIAEELVQTGGAVRVLATSRVPLDLAAESLVRLSGLTTSDHESDSPAEQLFVASARRAGATDDRLSGAGRTIIRDICSSVDGNPLALEVAGGWANVFSPEEILDTLSRNNDLLGSSMVGGLRTMDVVLNQAWSTLTETDQRALMLLATFPAGCPTKQALEIDGLPISSIGRLAKHSLVNPHIEGRITMHPLIANHALAELEQHPDLKRDFQQTLSNWCRSLAVATATESNSALLRTFSADIANLQSAWSWDAQHGHWDLHRATLAPLRQFFVEGGRVSEGRALFGLASEGLRSDPNGPQDLLAEVLEALGWLQSLSGELIQGRALLDEALTLTSEDHPHAKAQVLRSISNLQLSTGEIDEAAANLTSGLALIDDQPSSLAASIACDLAQVHRHRGARDEAQRVARSALEAARAANDRRVMTAAYLLLADIEVDSDPGRAIVLLNEGSVIAKEDSLDNLAIYFPHILGRAHLRLGDAEQAENHFGEGIEVATVAGQSVNAASNYIGRAEARVLAGSLDDAADDLTTGIRLALAGGSAHYLMWAAIVSCQVAAARHEPGPHVKGLLLMAQSHPAADQSLQDKAAKTLRQIFDESPEPHVETAASDATGLDEVAERSLQLLR